MKDYLKSWSLHISQKIKGIKYSERDKVNLLKKEMKKNKHSSKDICDRYGIDKEEFKALSSGRYYFNMNWYKIVSDYTGITIMELASFKRTLYSKLCIKMEHYKFVILDKLQ